MKLHILGSSSKGNCYVIQTDESAIVIESGVSLMEVKKALDFNLTVLSACLITHSHGDHNKFVNEYLKSAIPVYASQETISESKVISHNWKQIAPGQKITIGGFEIIPFDVVHDVKCFGYFFRYKDGNTFCFVTDTHYCPNTFKGLTNVIIECNYSEKIIEQRRMSGKLPKIVIDRVLRSHMSLETCKEFLLANDLTQVNNIVLIHLSDGNSDEKLFVKEISELTGKTVIAASPGKVINLSKSPF